MIGQSIPEAARDAIRLALGRPLAGSPNWESVFSVARGERLLGIAWLRSGAAIRAAAPPALVTAWRAAALEQNDRARGQLATLVTLQELFAGRGVRSSVLKGPPLSVRLYNDVGARHSVDIDVFVPACARAKASGALSASGWTKWLGKAPWDECFYRRGDDGVTYLEVHSLLPGEALAHCGPLAIETAPFTCADGTLDVLSGPAFPAYLAGNMAKHGVLPLSALVDFHELWESATVAEREAMVSHARAARLSRCLRWALARAQLLGEAADGQPGSLERLGVRAAGRVFGHAYLRLMRLSDNAVDAARIAAAWMWPRSSRESWEDFTGVWRRRLRKPLNDVGSFRQSYVGS